MSNKKFTILLFAILSFGIPKFVKSQTLPNQTTFSFTLPTSAKTSAGVFKSDGTLIRTLWSNVSYAAGTFTEKWDGVNDSGILAPTGKYNIKVLSSNVQYQWEGVVGNTSINRTGANHYNAQDKIWNMAISGNNTYFGTNYNEQQSSSQKFLVSNPQAKIDILGKGNEVKYIATDDNNVYWGGDDPNNFTSMVFVTKVSNDLEATLSSATPYQTVCGRKYTSAIDTLSGTVNQATLYTTAFITGMAVQKTGNYLFVARAALNSIHVIDKTTGAFITNISIKNPRGLALDASGNYIWVIDSLTAKKYAVNSDGTLGNISKIIIGFQNTLSVAVSPDNASVVIADGGASQQIKVYSNSTGISSWIYGQAGGYTVNGPAVTNNKFMFWEYYGSGKIKELGYIAFAPDGSFWLGDAGNCRNMHFSSGGTYIEQIMFHGYSYSVKVDKNNPGRVFNNYLEFAVDYTKPLDNGNNGSWTLKNNWAGNVNSIYDDQYNRLLGVTTLSNGRTYCLSQYNTANGKYQVLELTSAGIRYTGVIVRAAVGTGMSLYPDGSLRSIGRRVVGSTYSFTKQALAGFDALGNPSWGAQTTLGTTPVITSQDPGFTGNTCTLRPGEVTTSGLLIAFGADLTSTDYHLGAINPATNQWLWKTARGTSAGYAGDYPTDGSFDIANGVKYPGSVAMALGNNIVWGYYGEFWKNSEVNKWTMVHDDGLMVGVFGVTGKDTTVMNVPFTGMAGNAFSGNLVYSPLDTTTAYLYHNDESVHGGVHRWKISGLNTISEQTVAVNISLGMHGLLGSYFTSADLNSSNLAVSKVDKIINSIVTPAGTSSTRWTGFIAPDYSEYYTFYIKKGTGALLWVNDSLIIDNWSGSNASYTSDSLLLVAGNLYSIRLETMFGANAVLGWSSNSRTKQIIPTANLYPAAPVDTTNGIDLLEGLTSNSIFSSNMYGWTRTPLAEDYTSGSQYWSVRTSVKGYSQKYPDLYTKFNSNSGVYTLSRDLGTNNTATSWTLQGKVNYSGNYPNHGTGGGAYLEVLDRAGKIISRFYPGGGAYPISYIYGNNQIIVQSTDALLQFSMAATLPINITATSKGITFTYGNYSPVTTTVFDPTSNWQQPQTMRLYFFGNGRNYTRIIDIQSMRFITDRVVANQNPNIYRSVSTAKSVTAINVKAFTNNQNVNVEWTTQPEINADYYAIEKSSDGKQFSEVAVIRAKGNDSTNVNYNWVDEKATSGNNYYRIKFVAKTEEVIYSNIAIANINEKTSGFQIYPNPVTGNSFNLNFNNIDKGTYIVKLISTNGQVLTSKAVDHNGGTTTQIIPISNNLSKGMYLVNITGDNKTETKKIFIQ